MKTLESDIVVIGGGMSGLAAAISASERDASVIVLEKGSTTGGAGSMGMGLFAAGSHIQKEQMIELDADDAFQRFMEFTHWRVDARMIRTYLDKTASTIEWLEEMGVEFLGAYKYFPKSEPTWHIVKMPGSNKITERSASVLAKTMTDRAVELGAEIRFQTEATGLIMKNGRVTGVTARTADGNELTIECDCIVVGTGGFGDNPEMIREETGFEWEKDLYSYRIPGMTGDGLRMVWAAGGGRTPITMEIIYLCPELSNMYTTISETMRQPNLLVNLDGRRFMNEEIMQNSTYTGNAIARQRRRCAFTIITDRILDYYREQGLDMNAYQFGVTDLTKWDAQVAAYTEGQMVSEGGLAGLQEKVASEKCFFMADSLAGIAEQTGINYKNLEKTVDDYNGWCGSLDPQFCKSPKYLKKIEGKTFYAAKYFPGGYGSLGGIRINDRMEILTEDGLVVPGLYASGVDACTIYADSYLFYLPGNTMGFAINSGRMAGENAVDYMDSDEFIQ